MKTIAEKGAGFGRVAHAGSLPSLASRKPIKADLRSEISPWRALVWCYRDECLRAASNASDYADARVGDYASVRNDIPMPRGTIGGWLEAHEDAFAIDAKVSAWFEGVNRNWRDRLAAYAEKALIPPTGDEYRATQPFRCYGVMRSNGRAKVVYDENRKNGFCPLVWDLPDEKQIAMVQEFRELFDALLTIMPGWTLTKWRIVAQGS